jgi:transposase
LAPVGGKETPKMPGKRFVYSEAFKFQIVSELESGELTCVAQARRKYGISGAMTIHKWLRKYGKNHLLAKVVRVEKPEERDRLKELQKENERLKKALADTHMDSLLYRSWFEIVCREFGVEDLDAYKKKLESRRSR